MLLRPSLLLVAALVSAVAGAQTTAQLEFDSARHVVVYSSAKPPTSQPDSTQDFNGTSASVTLPSAGTLYVWDRDTGNIASKAVSDVGTKWHLADKDFSRIGLVAVRVEYQGEPVSAAQVILKDKDREQSQVLDPSADGEADFYIVQPGTETVTVQYRSGGSPAQPLVQQFPIDLDRKTPDPLLKVELPNAVATSTPPPASTPTNGQSTSKTPVVPIVHSNPLGSFFVFIFTLLVAILVAYGLYLLAKKYPDWLKGKLKKLGVDVPDDIVPPDPDSPEKKHVPVLEPAKPQPQSKIILADGALPAAPTPAASTATAVATQQAITKQPRLVKGNGEFAMLQEGETVVGREENLGLSLVGESSVSRRHATITRNGSLLTLRDLGSTNGTFVNGRRISADTPLSSGDDVQFGAVRFRVEGQ